MFKVLGALLLIYVGYCLKTGAVFARYGIWGRTYQRDAHVIGYWSAVGSYIALTFALLFVF
jgi:hypothetical protein